MSSNLLTQKSLASLLSNLVSEEIEIPINNDENDDDFTDPLLLNREISIVESSSSSLFIPTFGKNEKRQGHINSNQNNNESSEPRANKQEDNDHITPNRNPRTSPKVKTYIYSAPCNSQSCQAVQESTSSLLSARALAKSGRSQYAWNILDSLFSVQGSNGFLPRFRYAAPSSSRNRRNSIVDGNIFSENVGNSSHHDLFYFPGTDFPTSHLFGSTPSPYAPSPFSISQRVGLTSSGRISSPPFHASVVLDVFYLSNQTQYDVQYLQYFSEKLYDWHRFLHEYVMSGCPLYSEEDIDNHNDSNIHFDTKNEQKASKLGGKTISSNGQNIKTQVKPCYNIVHPWESMIDLSSFKSIYETLHLNTKMKQDDWKVPFPIPDSVLESPDYHGPHIYNSTLYLLNCLSQINNVSLGQKSTDPISNNDEDMSAYTSKLTSNYEESILNHCPFTMLNVGYASALSQSDASLLEINKILADKRLPNLATDNQINKMNLWFNQSQLVLKSLWNEDHNTFLSNLVTSEPISSFITSLTNITKSHAIETIDSDSKTHLNVPMDSYEKQFTSKPIPQPFVDNFMVLYGTNLLKTQKVEAVTYQIFASNGNFSFNCGEFPLYSMGGCPNVEKHNNDPHPLLILPLYNYWIAKGLGINNDEALQFFLQKSTINMVCQLPNLDITNISNVCNVNPEIFAKSYDAISIQPILDTFNDDSARCSKSSTLTAAIVYDTIVPDKAFIYEAAPPISNSWVFTLIFAELFIALSIGISCIVLSLYLIRKLKEDSEADNFVQLLMYERPDISDIYGTDVFQGNSGAESTWHSEDIDSHGSHHESQSNLHKMEVGPDSTS